MKCPNCSHSNESDSKFCINCGGLIFNKDAEQRLEDVLFVPKKEHSNSLKNFVLVGGVFVALIFVGLILLGSNGNSQNNNSTETTNLMGESDVSQAEINEWVPYTSVEHGFSVSFPTSPTSERIPQETSSGITYSGTQYIASTKDESTAYLAQAADYSVAPRNYDNIMGLEGLANTFVGGNRTLTSSNFTKFRGYDGLNFSFTTKDGYFAKGISIIRDDLATIKAITLLVMGKDSLFPDYEKFISSFSFK
jgi:hypothetical protein